MFVLSHNGLLSSWIQVHSLGDMCIVGERAVVGGIVECKESLAVGKSIAEDLKCNTMRMLNSVRGVVAA